MLNILSFILDYKSIIIFYLIIIIFLIAYKKRLEFQSKIIILYRMKFGLNFIEKITQKFREWIIVVGYIGVGVGYVGMLAISYVMIKNIYDLITVPSAVSGVSLVLPGVNVPGMGILPFWYWLIAIFIIAIVHEFSHGIVGRAHNIPIKNTGIVFLGPIIGAFVEPDEEKMTKEKDIVQYSVLAAGAFSNIILALVALLLLSYAFTPLQESMNTPTGFTFDTYVNETFPIAQAGITPQTLITGINDNSVKNFQEFNEELSCTSPGEKIKISTLNKTYSLALTSSPDNPKKGFLGIKDIHNEFETKAAYQSGIGKIAYDVVEWISGFLRWLFLLSLGIGLFNLLPLPIVDGGRMLQVTLHKTHGKEKGEKHYKQVSIFFLLILVLSLLYPLFMKLF